MLSAQSFYSPCLQAVVHSVFPGMCHSSTHPGTSYHVTQFYQAFPRVIVLQATNAGVRSPGYKASCVGHQKVVEAKDGITEQIESDYLQYFDIIPILP